jgi:hypothetical protein
MTPQRGDNSRLNMCNVMEEKKTMKNVKLKSKFLWFTASDWAFFLKKSCTPPPPHSYLQV